MTIRQPSPTTVPFASAKAQWSWLAAALTLVLLTRLATLGWRAPDLHVDEAQYWFWSQHLDWGYFSKPPGIAAAIRLSTTLFGDSPTGIRLVCMLCWLGSAAILYRLGTRLHSGAAGVWAALILTASPASNLLGLVATTDALLMVGWCATMALAWEAINAPHRRLRWWLATGLAWGLTLQSKYTALALAPGLLWAVLAAHRLAPRQNAKAAPSVWTGLLVCGSTALLVWTPNLIWNGVHHWPTLGHTAQITWHDGAAVQPGDWLHHAATFLGGVLLLAGPAWCMVQICRVSTGTPHTQTPSPALAWPAYFVWPLLTVGLLQSLRGGGQLNWAAPVVAGMSLQAGCWLATQRRGLRRVLAAAATGWLLCLIVAGSHDLRTVASPSQPVDDRPLDFWHKTRHWNNLLLAMGDVLPVNPPSVVATGARDVHAQATYAWRGRPIALKAWASAPPPQHHFELTQPLTQPLPDTLYWLDREPPPAALVQQYRHAELVKRVSEGSLTLQLWTLADARPEGAAP